MRDRELYATILGVEAPRTVERVELYGAPERLRDREGGDVESRGQGLIGWVSKLWRLMRAMPSRSRPRKIQKAARSHSRGYRRHRRPPRDGHRERDRCSLAGPRHADGFACRRRGHRRRDLGSVAAPGATRSPACPRRSPRARWQAGGRGAPRIPGGRASYLARAARILSRWVQSIVWWVAGRESDERVDDVDAGQRKVPHVSRGDREAVAQGCCADQRIQERHPAPLLPQVRHQPCPP